MGIINFSIPKEIVGKIINDIEINNFVETGTFYGDTSIWAAENFKNIFTIEIQPEIYKETSEKFADKKNIKFIFGNSKDCLPEICKNLVGQTFFWLDGHWCGGSGEKLDEECPLLGELEAISVLSDPIIFIDDARCFVGPQPPPHNENWPYLDDIFAFTKNKFPNHFTTIQDDVIMCVPQNVKKIIDKHWEEGFNEKYYSNKNAEKKVINPYKALRNRIWSKKS